MTWDPRDCAQQGHTPADHVSEFDVESAETYRTDVSADEIKTRDPVCVRCGRRRSQAAHHRKMRSQGGLDTWDNQVGLCHDCHTLGPVAVHRSTGLAYDEGWLVESFDTPSTVPLNYHGRGRVLLGTDGSINEVIR